MNNKLETPTKELHDIRKRLKRYSTLNLTIKALISPLVLLLCGIMIFPPSCTATSVFICTTTPLRIGGILLAIYYIGEIVASCRLLALRNRLYKAKYAKFESQKIVNEINFCAVFMGIFIISTALIAADCQDYFYRNQAENPESQIKK